MRSLAESFLSQRVNQPDCIPMRRMAAHPSPRFDKFDHARKADLFRISIPFDQAQQLLAALLAAAPSKLKHRWSTLRPRAALTLVCPRK